MRPRRLLSALATAALLALAAGACGDDDGGAATTGAGAPTAPAGDVTATATNPIATAPEATAPPPDATAPGDATVAPPPPATDPAPAPPTTEPAEPDAPAGGEDPVRVPATFAIRGGRLEPATVTVPAFLAVEVSIASADRRRHAVVVRTPDSHRLTVAGDGRPTSVRLGGLRAGRYAIEVDGAPAGTLVAGGEAGP